MEKLSNKQMIEVIKFVVEQRETRASRLQIKFLWGYNRADNTMEELEKLGVVGESKGVIGREVIISLNDATKLIKQLNDSCSE